MLRAEVVKRYYGAQSEKVEDKREGIGRENSIPLVFIPSEDAAQVTKK